MWPNKLTSFEKIPTSLINKLTLTSETLLMRNQPLFHKNDMRLKKLLIRLTLTRIRTSLRNENRKNQIHLRELHRRRTLNNLNTNQRWSLRLKFWESRREVQRTLKQQVFIRRMTKLSLEMGYLKSILLLQFFKWLSREIKEIDNSKQPWCDAYFQQKSI